MLALVKRQKTMATTDADTGPTLAELVSLDNASPDLARTRARRNELCIKVQQAEAELNQIARSLGPLMPSAEMASRPVDRESEARVAALVEGVAPGMAAAPDYLLALERRAQKRQEVADLKAAIEVLDARIAELQREASHVVVERVAPLYAARVAAVARALIALHEEHVAYDQLADALNDERVWWSKLGPMAPVFLDSSQDKCGRVANYLKEAAELGFITRDEIPERLR